DHAVVADYPADLGIVAILTPASASPSIVTGNSASLSVLGTGTVGESNLTYTWAATTKPSGSNPVFSANGTNAAKNCTVPLDPAGTYIFTVTASDGSATATSAATTTATQTFQSITVSPSSTTAVLNQVKTFSATAKDQFSQAMLIQPLMSWSIASGGVGAV